MPEQNVSIVIPTFNRAHLIDRAIRSALDQCLPGDEIIVVDDGSTDNTAAVVGRYGARVRYLAIPNGGAGAARNHGIRHARCPLIAFLDSDDEWFAGKLQMQRRLMAARPEIVFCFGNFAVTTKTGREIRRYLVRWLRQPRSWDEALGPGVPYSTVAKLPEAMDDVQIHIGNLYAAELVDNYVLTSSLMVRRAAAGDALHFAEEVPIYEDWYCFSRLARKGPAAYLDCELAWQHGHDGSRVTDTRQLVCATLREQLVQTIWASDDHFLQQHGQLFEQTLALNRLDHLRALIKLGLMREARAMLPAVDGVPGLYRLLVRLPGSVVRLATAFRRREFGRTENSAAVCLGGAFSR